ncbi:Mariner Mos1 transposase [Anthophora plagiata]
MLELGYQILLHPSSSPDLAPSDYYLFPNMKKWLKQITILQTYEDKSYYMKGIAKLEHRWTKCIELEGDYVEK